MFLINCSDYVRCGCCIIKICVLMGTAGLEITNFWFFDFYIDFLGDFVVIFDLFWKFLLFLFFIIILGVYMYFHSHTYIWYWNMSINMFTWGNMRNLRENMKSDPKTLKNDQKTSFFDRFRLFLYCHHHKGIL